MCYRAWSNEQFMRQHIKNKYTIFFRTWLSKGCLNTHLAKSLIVSNPLIYLAWPVKAQECFPELSSSWDVCCLTIGSQVNSYNNWLCFSQNILLEGQSGPWRFVLGANFLGKGPTDNNWQKNSCQMQMSGRQILVWRSGMKAPNLSKEQYKGIHDIVNGQGFAMHYRAISNMVSHFVFWCERINIAKQKNGLTSFLLLSVLHVDAKIFQHHGSLEEHKVSVNNHYWPST